MKPLCHGEVAGGGGGDGVGGGGGGGGGGTIGSSKLAWPGFVIRL